MMRSDGARALGDRSGGSVRARTRGQVEAEVTQGMIRFERELTGRGPADTLTRIVQDMVIVRMTDVLTPAERALIRGGGVDLLKQVRTRFLESEKGALVQMLRNATGCEDVGMFSDPCPMSGEHFVVFILNAPPESRPQ
jgi:uncharacterized protein YbcI